MYHITLTLSRRTYDFHYFANAFAPRSSDLHSSIAPEVFVGNQGLSEQGWWGRTILEL